MRHLHEALPGRAALFVLDHPKAAANADMLDEEIVAEIKVLYDACDLTLAEIGARYGVTAPAISQLARRRCWLRRSELRRVKAGGHVSALEQVREVVGQRVGTTILTRLRTMEADMKSGKLTSQDLERDAKSLAAMLSGFDKTAATARHEDKTRKPKSAALETPESVDEVERLHGEIMERFERIQRRRESEAGSE